MNGRDPVADFRAAIAGAGLPIPDEIIPDGELHRFATNGKASDLAGWYRLHMDRIPAGAFGCFRAELSETWSAKPEQSMTAKDRADHKRRMVEIRQQRAAEQRRRHAEAAVTAAEIWDAAEPAPVDHPYLVRKGIQPHGIRTHDGALVVPVRDNGELASLQFIQPDGSKRFMPGGKVQGCYASIGSVADVLCIAEGYATAATIHEATGHPVAVSFNCGNLRSVAEKLRSKFPESKLILCADDDAGTDSNPGVTSATEAARAAGGLLAVPDFGTVRPDGVSDFNDLHRLAGLEAVKVQIENAEPFVPFVSEQEGAFSDFSALPPLLPPVPDFDPALLPDSLRGWVSDCAESLQCPLAFVAVPAVVALAGVIGRQLGVAMKQHERWIERPVLWAGIVGRPSSGKSPALAPVQRLLHRLEAGHREEWESEKHAVEVDLELHGAERLAAKKVAAKRIAQGDREGARAALDVAEPAPPPPPPRLIVNDATVEKLGELLNENQRGLVQFRDELSGWLASLDRDGREADRSFWLECWNGKGPYTCDRIGRGSVRVEACAVSIIGGIQPGRLGEYLRSAVRGGLGDDGLMQRFQLAVYPDLPPMWRWQDRAFDSTAEARAWAAFQRLDGIDPDAVGAEQPDWCDVPFIRMSTAASSLFAEWQTELMQRLRAGSEAPHMEAHLAKYPATAGRLALVLHMADNDSGPVGEAAIIRALAWLQFLEPHARRLYAGIDSATAAAHLLLAKRRDLPDPFTSRDAYRRHWAGLDREAVEAGLAVLTDHGYIAECCLDTGGRPSITYRWRPGL